MLVLWFCIFFLGLVISVRCFMWPIVHTEKLLDAGHIRFSPHSIFLKAQRIQSRPSLKNVALELLDSTWLHIAICELRKSVGQTSKKWQMLAIYRFGTYLICWLTCLGQVWIKSIVFSKRCRGNNMTWQTLRKIAVYTILNSDMVSILIWYFFNLTLEKCVQFPESWVNAHYCSIDDWWMLTLPFSWIFAPLSLLIKLWILKFIMSRDQHLIHILSWDIVLLEKVRSVRVQID